MTTRIKQAAELVKTQPPHQLAMRVVELTHALRDAQTTMAGGILDIDHVIGTAPGVSPTGRRCAPDPQLQHSPRNHAVQSQIVEMAAKTGASEQSALPLIDALRAAGFEWPHGVRWVAQDWDGQVWGSVAKDAPLLELCPDGDGRDAFWLVGPGAMLLLDLPPAPDQSVRVVSREEYEQHTGGDNDR